MLSKPGTAAHPVRFVTRYTPVLPAWGRHACTQEAEGLAPALVFDECCLSLECWFFALAGCSSEEDALCCLLWWKVKARQPVFWALCKMKTENARGRNELCLCLLSKWGCKKLERSGEEGALYKPPHPIQDLNRGRHKIPAAG